MSPENDSQKVAARDKAETPSLVIISCGFPEHLARLADKAPAPGGLIWIDPFPLPAKGPLSGLRDRDGLDHIEAVPATSAGEVTLTRYSVPGLYGVTPTLPVLRELYPGLRVQRKETVQAIDPGALAQRISGLGTPLHVVVDSPGLVTATLAALDRDDLLDRVETMEIHCGIEPFFEDASDAGIIRHWAAKRSFLITSEDSDDADWPVLHIAADKTARQSVALKARIAKLEAENLARNDALSQTRTERDSARAELAARDKELADLRAGAEKRAAEAKELTAQLETAKTQAAEVRATAEERKTQLAEISSKADWRYNRIQELEAQIEEKEKANETARKKNAEQEKLHQEQQHRLTLARNDLRRSEGQIELIKDLLLRGETL